MRLRDTDSDFIGLPVRRRLLISVPFLSTGGALAVFILTGISLRVGMIAARPHTAADRFRGLNVDKPGQAESACPGGIGEPWS